MVDELYGSNPILNTVKIKLDNVVGKAQESGDEYKMDIGARVQKSIEDNAETYAGYFERVPEEKHQELADVLVKDTIQQAKRAYNQENDIDNKIEELYSAGKYDEGLALSQSTADDAIGTEYRLNNIMDEVDGINEIEKVKKSQRPKEIQPGRFVSYSVKMNNPGSNILNPTGIDDDLQVEVKQEANKSAREYGMKNPDKFVEIKWDKRDDIPEGTNDQRVALDALVTWRQDVLPSLKPGMIVFNQPKLGGRGKNQRERIYKMAGFGDYSDKHEAQYGLVVLDDSGNNQVVPIQMTQTKVMEESRKTLLSLKYIREADVWASSEETLNILYETLGL